ncbi:MAG: hypothetical protein DDT22_00344 [candidate division WS2 bacterium]|nr:hypothetical protein [Bacillota bacterium]MBT9174683.1 hypothetical protein [Candidatus Lithacetigena glycinireducens]
MVTLLLMYLTGSVVASNATAIQKNSMISGVDGIRLNPVVNLTDKQLRAEYISQRIKCILIERQRKPLKITTGKH